MTLLVWAGWRLAKLVRRNDMLGGPNTAIYIAAIVVSALVFGMGHLPLASILNGGLTLPLILYVITSNSLFGIVAGFLYWLRGLEAAMIAHICVHVILIAAILLSF